MNTYSIIMPTLGNHDVLWKSIESVSRSIPSSAEFYVVYNGKPERAPVFHDQLAKFTNVRWIATPVPYGIARANNFGYSQSTGNYVVFIHDDVMIKQADWLQELQGVLDRYPDVGMVGGSEAKYIDRTAGKINQTKKDVTICDWSPTISMARRSDIEAGCRFDEFYLVGLEDKDWALSFRHKGKEVVYFPIRHDHVGTKGSYSVFLEEKFLLSYYSKEGVRERYYLNKNRAVLDPGFVARELAKWRFTDRNWKKSWWMKLYAKYYVHQLKEMVLGKKA